MLYFKQQFYEKPKDGQRRSVRVQRKRPQIQDLSDEPLVGPRIVTTYSMANRETVTESTDPETEGKERAPSGIPTNEPIDPLEGTSTSNSLVADAKIQKVSSNPNISDQSTSCSRSNSVDIVKVQGSMYFHVQGRLDNFITIDTFRFLCWV